MNRQIIFFSNSENDLKKLERLLILDNFNTIFFTDFKQFQKFVKENKNKSNLYIIDINGLEIINNNLLNLFKNKSNFLIISSFPKKYFRSLDGENLDFFKKPVFYEELLTIIENKLNYSKTEKKNKYKKYNSNFITNSLKMKNIYKKIEKIAKTDATVLITGETGTGKEVIADTIQQKSNRKNKRFVKINCAALPDNLLESELFGYDKGAFTGANSTKIGKFEYADKGTIFLDEIGEMPLKLQAKLLRVLQENKVERIGSNEPIDIDVRVLTATNRDLKKIVNENKFRNDLYYRLNVITIEIPPLRDRKNDIVALSNYFLKQFNDKYNKSFYKFSENVIKIFKKYEWPGNVRELKNLIESIVILSNKKIITVEDLPHSFKKIDINKNLNINLGKIKANEGNKNKLKTKEKKAIIEELKKTNGNKSQAARNLGISRKTLYNKLEKYGKKN